MSRLRRTGRHRPSVLPNTSRRRIRRSVAVASALALAVSVVSADYEVQPGDTLAGIAARLGVDPSALADQNDIGNPDLIFAGQILTIPGENATPPVEPALHVVSVGETLATIASGYGSSVSALVSANGIANPDLIRPGQILTIPTGGPGNGAIGPTTHIVRRGDTLESIARRYGTTVAAIAERNGILDGVIYEGTRLTVGGAPPPAPQETAASESVHVVTPGETLAAIAGRYSTDVSALAAANGIVDPDLIVVGQEIAVPGAGWRCPVPGATYFNDWGFPRSGGRFHQGNDLFAPAGTAIVAPVAGEVTFVEGRIGGRQFWLTGGDGATYIGTHMDSFGTGGSVTAGTVIGTVGTSGNAAGSRPHLHLEMHVDDVPVNPYPTLAAAGC